MSPDVVALLVLIAVLTGAMIGVSLYIYYGRLIMRSRMAGTPVSFGRMLGLTLAGLNAHALVTAYLDAQRAGARITLDQLESLARAKGDPREAVHRVIAAGKEGGVMTLEEASTRQT